MKKRHEQKLVILGIGLLVVLNIPVLLIFDIPGSILGVPVLYFSIFCIWAFSIVISYIVLKRYYE